MKPKILAFAGSLRKGSFNKKLALLSSRHAVAAGAEVTWVDLKDYPMPVYDGDIEASDGLPAAAKKLKQLFIENQGFLLSSPEYNSSIPGGLKNAIDWMSRAETKDETPLAAFRGKTYALFAASTGALGGLRGLVPLRMMLGNIGALVLPGQIAVSKADEAFDSNDELKDAKLDASVKRLAEELVRTVAKLGASG